MKSNEFTLPQRRIADRRRPNVTQQTEPLFPVVVPITQNINIFLGVLTTACMRVGCPICLIHFILRTISHCPISTRASTTRTLALLCSIVASLMLVI
ncbi:hypothetical protein VNO78_14682 [Psophocarpus tetragonolobus]|uniref:Uncharacterized protein n=1 Tax=Psophocarpus tetragonolobus TaxID=3891 RepID=A0AAN9SDI7_PSOTE